MNDLRAAQGGNLGYCIIQSNDRKTRDMIERFGFFNLRRML